ncbi:MAG TPA: hypothetical protein VGH79_04720 [Gaiellaceae bacterium]|jgi:hypothetical protein
MAWEPTDTIAALDELDELVRRAGTVPLTEQVRLDPARLDAVIERLRAAVSGGPLELSYALDQLAELARGAKAIPLTNEVRVEREELYDKLDRMRAACARPSREHLPPAVAAALGAFDELLENAKLVPLTMQVRLDRAKTLELLDRLRAARQEPSPDAAAALAELDVLVHNAKSIPLTKDIRVSIVELSELLDRIGTA